MWCQEQVDVTSPIRLKVRLGRQRFGVVLQELFSDKGVTYSGDRGAKCAQRVGTAGAFELGQEFGV